MGAREDMAAMCGAELARLVVLRPPPASPTLEDLLPQLREAAAEVIEFDDALAACSEVALHDRLDSTRAAWGLASHGITCLVVVNAEAIEDLDDLLSAVARYFRHIAVLACAPDDPQPWRLLHEPTDGRPSGSPEHPFRKHDRARSATDPAGRSSAAPGASRASAPSLRLVEAPVQDELEAAQDLTESAEAASLSEPASAGTDEAERLDDDGGDDDLPRVSRDEIAMLLRPDETADEDDDRREAAS